MDNTNRITADTILYYIIWRIKYCGFGEMYTGYDTRNAKYMSLKNIIPLIEYLCELWNTNLTDSSLPITFFSFYGGEP